ncbi:DUF4279 domain-containing protein [Lapillicoccus sp.]|uniref:DUF4279 domain-containing protein n=1 Tax=Lapillicoccus sp. TaxID=1909287 RepID=UPI0025D9626B|nr:DUF4279 domain-containing protein [Lapillicoccus sp.]
MSQYAYFALRDETTTAAEVTGYLGIEPDEVRVRASTRVFPPRPASHSWAVVSRNENVALDVHITRVLDRVAPAAGHVRRLVDDRGVEARLVIVRYFSDDGEAEEFDASITPGGDLVEHLPGPHPPLGWFLSVEALTLLTSMRASIWADEYG